MAKIVYPLIQVLEIKEKRVKEQEKVVAEKERALKAEQEKLKQREQERDQVKQHHQDKLNQMREEMDKGTTSPKILQMKAYIKVVKERLKTEEKKVEDQKEQVSIAERNLAEAVELLRIKRQEVEKLETHRKDWEKEMRRQLQFEEEKEMDEIGNIMHIIHQKRGY